MERRVLLAVLLSFVVLYGYQALFPPPPDATKKPAATQQASPGAQPVAPASSAASSAQDATPQPVAGAPLPEAASGVGEAPAQEVTVQTAGVDAVFTTRGGAVKSWRLRHYHDAAGQDLELVATHPPAGAARPFTLAVDDPDITARLATALYHPSATHLDAQTGTQALTFEYRDASGLEAKKTLTFSADHPYSVVVAASVTKNGQALPTIVQWGPAIGSGIVPKSRTYNPPPQPVFYRGGKVSRIKQDKIATEPVEEGTFGFAGVDDHYFLAAVIEPKQPLRLSYQETDVTVPGSPEPAKYVSWSARFPNAPQSAVFFFGPKDFDILASVDRDLVRSIDFGMFSWLVVPLLRALKWLNGYLHNYGWSVVALTVLINLAMFPLRHKSVVSMRKMQEIQPEVKQIQERYAKLKMSDPARSKMNTELMNLYRERGVNPASGCVPMLLTMPVLFAFYSMLSVAIELRGAPFIFWIHDLSAPDPLYVLPVLMGLSMFAQQKMTPSTADPTQQTMMMIMPVVLTFMSLWWASGLLLYWTTSNVWGIGQQVITNRLIGPSKPHNVRPPGERLLKKAGAGKTDQAKERK